MPDDSDLLVLTWRGPDGREDGAAAAVFGGPGKSAYQIAVAAGFEGTEAEWLASLQGARDWGELGGLLSDQADLQEALDAKADAEDVDAAIADLAETVGQKADAAAVTEALVGKAAADDVAEALALKAPLASPELTGAPLGPTAAPATNTAQLATTAFVRGEIAALVNGAPAQLDTLDELAAALADDANFAAAVTAALALKAPLADPAFTGAPTAPTQAGGNNSTRLATTAFVQGELAAKAGKAAPTFTGLIQGDRLALSPTANNSALAVSGFSLTGANAQSLFDLAGTWNTTGTPTALKLNVTDTASNAASLLADLQVGGTSKFAVGKDGVVYLGATNSKITPQANGISLGGSKIRAFVGGLNTGGFHGLYMGAISVLGFSSSNTPTAIGYDVGLFRDDVGQLALRHGVNAQAFRIYNTFTDGSNYERGFARWNANVFEIGTAAAGTGTVRDLALVPAGGGAIRMGTHTAIGAETVTGYITIKDAGGTTRKLAVVS